jgi:hypothetical protein
VDSRRCHEAGYAVQPQSRWMRAIVPLDKFSYLEEKMLTAFFRRCTLWIWPPVRVRDSLPFSTCAFIMQWLSCRMGASSAREVWMTLMICRRRRCGARRSKGG